MRTIGSLARLAVVLLCALLARDAMAARGPIRWVSDDYARAAAEARKRDVLLVVDAWAPW